LPLQGDGLRSEEGEQVSGDLGLSPPDVVLGEALGADSPAVGASELAVEEAALVRQASFLLIVS